MVTGNGSDGMVGFYLSLASSSHWNALIVMSKIKGESRNVSTLPETAGSLDRSFAGGVLSYH